MKIGHLADTHLGFRQYQASEQGTNLRERDVAQAFSAAIDGVAAWRPDVLLHAGDLFHYPRPVNAAIRTAVRQITRFQQRCPGVPIIVIAGNHDHPRTTETGHLLPMLTDLGVHVAVTEPLRVRIGDLSVLAVPHAALATLPELTPDPTARYNVLLMHGDVPAVAHHDVHEAGGHLLPTDETGWDYIALGHYHVPCRVGARTWYAGSPEYVSTNPWRESREMGCAGQAGGKGWLAVTLTKAEPVVAFQPLPTRRFVDLPRFSALGMDEQALDQALRGAVGSVGDLAGVVLRQVVTDVDRTVWRAIDHTQIRAWKAQALHFRLDLRMAARTSGTTPLALPGMTLNDVVHAYLAKRESTVPIADVQALFDRLSTMPDPYAEPAPEPAASAASVA